MGRKTPTLNFDRVECIAFLHPLLTHLFARAFSTIVILVIPVSSLVWPGYGYGPTTTIRFSFFFFLFFFLGGGGGGSILLTILDAVRVLPIFSMYQNFNLQFTSSLSSLASVLPLMVPLFGIHFLKTSAHHPLLPLLERSSKPISTQTHILLSSFSLMASLVVPTCFCPWTLNLHIAIAYCLVAPTQWRLSTIKVKLELELCQMMEIKCYKSTY